MKKPLPVLAFCTATAALLTANGVDPRRLHQPLAETWSSYSGDYSGKRFSALAQINKGNVKNLTLAWSRRLTGGPTPGAIIGGVGDINYSGATQIKGSILAVDGALYVTAPDNTWALDASDGHELWHYFWKTRGGTHIGNRGAGMWGNYLFFVTPDNYLVSVEARTGKERWRKELASFQQQYFHTMAPMVVENKVLVGSSNDLDMPAFLQAFEPERGELLWKWFPTPQNDGDPGLETWKSLQAARIGGGHPWIPGSYDPDTRLYIIGTGNPTPAYTSAPRGEGMDNLYTCALVALNIDTGKMAWYYQTSPHDTHDWDSAQTPILVDGQFNGRPRKMAMTAARNGYFFVVDRLTGEHLLTSKFSEAANWASGLNAKGQPVRIPAKDHHVAGALVSSSNYGATNWPPGAFSPQTGLFYVPMADSYAMYYLTVTDPRGAIGLGGKEEIGVGSRGSYLLAIDYKTGTIAWRHRYRNVEGNGRGNGVLATAGGLVFAGDIGGNIVAHDAATGGILWHAQVGANVSNAPQTHMLDGKQYLLVAAGDTLYAFYLY